MSRLTKNISDKQTYCGYEVKNCKYQQLYDFEEYNELEDYVDCDLTLAIDKLGQLEDLEEQQGCPLNVVFKAVQNGIYTKNLPSENIIKQFNLQLSNIQTEWYLFNNIMCVNLKDYKKTWWLKEDRSE